MRPTDLDAAVISTPGVRVADGARLRPRVPRSPRLPARPRVFVVGGCDVHKRTELMGSLAAEFELTAVGSELAAEAGFAEAGFPFVHFPLKRGGSPLSDLRSTAALRRIFQNHRPDIVHAFATKPCVWGRLAAHSAGVPVVVGTIAGLGSLYSSDGLRTRLIRGVYERLQRSACGRSDFTIFQNRFDAQEFIGAGISAPEKSAVIPGSGVRTELFDVRKVSSAAAAALRAELRIPQGAVLVTMISRLIRSKGVLEFAEAAKAVRARHPSARFLLVGPDDRESLDVLTSDELSTLCGYLTWAGEREDVMGVLAASDVFVLPSYYREGVPRVLLEAASMGLPLIAAKAPGCEDVIIPARNGFLVPPRQPKRLIDAVVRLIEQPDLRKRFANESRKLAVERFDLKVIARQTGELYWRLLEGRIDR